MRIVRYIILAICLCVALYATIAFGVDYVKGERDQTTEILFSGFCVLAILGILAVLANFLAKAIASVTEMLFLGFFAGIMLTNIVSEILSGTTYNSMVGYLASYGLMALVLLLSVTGCCLIQLCLRKKRLIGKGGDGLREERSQSLWGDSKSQDL
ncbi:MAG: hypothetical protein ACYS9T_09060 [Planctomycetota bacterium]|jgi:hypothetical protein